VADGSIAPGTPRARVNLRVDQHRRASMEFFPASRTREKYEAVLPQQRTYNLFRCWKQQTVPSFLKVQTSEEAKEATKPPALTATTKGDGCRRCVSVLPASHRIALTGQPKKRKRRDLSRNQSRLLPPLVTPVRPRTPSEGNRSIRGKLVISDRAAHQPDSMRERSAVLPTRNGDGAIPSSIISNEGCSQLTDVINC